MLSALKQGNIIVTWLYVATALLTIILTFGMETAMFPYLLKKVFNVIELQQVLNNPKEQKITSPQL